MYSWWRSRENALAYLFISTVIQLIQQKKQQEFVVCNSVKKTLMTNLLCSVRWNPKHSQGESRTLNTQFVVTRAQKYFNALLILFSFSLFFHSRPEQIMKGRNVWTWKKLHKMKIPRKIIARFFSPLDILFNACGSSPMSHEGSLMLSSPPRAMWTWTYNVNSSREILQITPKNFCAILIGVNSHCTHIIIIAQFYYYACGTARDIAAKLTQHTRSLNLYHNTKKYFLAKHKTFLLSLL